MPEFYLWRRRRLPVYARAALDSLKLSGDVELTTSNFSAVDWKNLLDFCDRTQLTLAFAQKRGENAPAWVKRRLERSLSQNAVRWERVRAAFSECASALARAGIPFAVLKGFSHCPDLIADPRLRTQYDLDLLFSPRDASRAYHASLSLGFEPVAGFDRFPIDHLPTLIRKTGWEWRGDFFDTEIPVSLELHYRLWDERTERFAPGGLDQFWQRRQSRQLEGISFVALHPADTIGYACLHILRHLLRGSVRPSHVYELALFLDRRHDDDAFWRTWEEIHDRSLQRIEAIVFGLACCWFDCRLSPTVRDALTRLRPEIRRWLAMYGESPLAGLFYPNKDDIWLHWNLVNSSKARVSVIGRRLFPRSLPGAVQGIHIPNSDVTWKSRVKRRWAYLQFVVRRATHHAMAMFPTAWSAIHWWARRWKIRSEWNT